jgi:hypothetical protein
MRNSTEGKIGWILLLLTTIAGSPAFLTKEIDHEQRKDNV